MEEKGQPDWWIINYLYYLFESIQVTSLQFWPEEHIKVMDFGFLKVNHKGTIEKDTGYDVITLEVFDKRKVMGYL